MKIKNFYQTTDNDLITLKNGLEQSKYIKAIDQESSQLLYEIINELKLRKVIE